MIRVTDTISLDEREIEERFVRASGPGGQNVNKVSTAVELRFDVIRSALPGEVRTRLTSLAGSRMTADGVLVLRGDRYRTQERNRDDVRSRLIALIAKAAIAPKRRIATRVPKSEKRARIDTKVKRSSLKKLRRPEFDQD